MMTSMPKTQREQDQLQAESAQVDFVMTRFTAEYLPPFARSANPDWIWNRILYRQASKPGANISAQSKPQWKFT